MCASIQNDNYTIITPIRIHIIGLDATFEDDVNRNKRNVIKKNIKIKNVKKCIISNNF